MARAAASFICQDCGAAHSKWIGRCDGCGAWNSVVEEAPVEQTPKGLGVGKGHAISFVGLSGKSSDADRRLSGISEFDRVCGGGLVPGSAVLIGGDPGIGKSTLVLQVLSRMATDTPCSYISGEEAIGQIRMRATRLGLSDSPVQLAAATSVRDIISTLEETGLAEDTRVAYISDHGENLGTLGLWGKSTMNEESAGIPMILRGPDIPKGKVVHTPVSLSDFHPTILECIGASGVAEDADLPGESLFKIAAADDDPDRTILSQYHGAAATSAAYMLRQGAYKYVHYVGFAPELFDLENDPEEMTNLAEDEQYQSVLDDFEAKLRGMIDPEETDRRAKADQARLIEAHGGRDAVLTRGGQHGTPAPGEKPDLASE